MRLLIVGALAATVLAAPPAEAQHVRVDASVLVGRHVRIGVHTRPHYYRTHVYRPHVYRTHRHYRPWYRRPFVRAVVVVPRPHYHHVVPRGHVRVHGRGHPRVERRYDRHDRDDRRHRGRRGR